MMMANVMEKSVNTLKQQLPFIYRISVTVLEIVMAIVLALMAAKLFLMFLSDNEVVSKEIDAVFSEEVLPNQSQKNQYNNLRSVDVFFGSKITIANTNQNDVPESSLDIKIFGLRANGEGGGSVILKKQGEFQKLFFPGDEISNGIKVDSIFNDRIEISRSGRIETIFLNKDQKRKVNNAQSTNQAPRKINDNSQKITNLESFIQSLDLTPFRTGNRIKGFVVGTSVEKTIASLAGLQVGDIVKTVNGNELHSWERVSEIPEELNNAENIELVLERNGEDMNLILPVSSLGI